MVQLYECDMRDAGSTPTRTFFMYKNMKNSSKNIKRGVHGVGVQTRDLLFTYKSLNNHYNTGLYVLISCLI